MSAIHSPTAVRPQAALPPSRSGRSPVAAGSFAPKSRETAQSGAEFPPPIETRVPAVTAIPSPQRPAALSVIDKSIPSAIETPVPPETRLLQQPASPAAETDAARQELGRTGDREQSPALETGEERALIAEGFALLVSEVRKGNRGRPTVVDEPMKARIATLMGYGLSLRQAAACLGIDHTTISRAVAADPALKREIDAARTRATLHPLACILRESGKNWKAAVWLLNHLKSVSYQEKTMQERAEIDAATVVQLEIEHDLRPRLLAEARAELAAQGKLTLKEQVRLGRLP